MKKPKSVKQIISSRNSGLGNLAHQSSKLNRLNRELVHLLPPPLPDHCSIAKIENGVVTLIVDSPAWASRARFQTQTIIKGLTKFKVKSVNIKTKLSQPSPPKTVKHKAKMSFKTSNLLIQLAEATTDQRLKQALLRLSQHTNK
ncbi:DciA family protein [Pseudomonadota bacterium]